MINKLFVKLQKKKRHMSILLDEYGQVSGIVTMEDLIEEVMGDIEDEFDDKVDSLIVLGEGRYQVSGQMPIYDFNDIFHTKIQCEDVDTIGGGYLLMKLGELPGEHNKETIKENGLTLLAEGVEGNRIDKVIVKRATKISME